MPNQFIKIICLSFVIVLCSASAYADIYNRQSTPSSQIFNSPKSQKEKDTGQETKSNVKESGREKDPSHSSKQNSAPSQNADLPDVNINIYPYYVGAAQNCLGTWSSQKCMQILSSSAMALTKDYAYSLNKGGQTTHLEPLRQNCAASTAATRVDVSPKVQRSAIGTCVNHIATVYEQTNIRPHPDLYQLLAGAVFCFDKNSACVIVEQGLKTVLSGQKKR